jgi:hypothetical protein
MNYKLVRVFFQSEDFVLLISAMKNSPSGENNINLHLNLSPLHPKV